MRRSTIGAVACGVLLLLPVIANAQTNEQNQLRATIYSKITADPRSQTMTQAQIYAMVNALAAQAQKQGVTDNDLTQAFEAQPGTAISCSTFMCKMSHAFGLDGSIPLIPLAFLALGALFIAIYAVMRDMGHPHAQA